MNLLLLISSDSLHLETGLGLKKGLESLWLELLYLIYGVDQFSSD